MHLFCRDTGAGVATITATGTTIRVGTTTKEVVAGTTTEEVTTTGTATPTARAEATHDSSVDVGAEDAAGEDGTKG